MTLETEVSKPVLTAQVHEVGVEPPQTPASPTPRSPIQQASVLPQTGDEWTPLNIIVSLVGAILFGLGLVGVRKRHDK